MLLERMIETAVWIITTILLIVFVPKRKWHEAQLSFIFMQVPSCLFGLLVVEYNLIEYPVRFFANATNSSFTFEYYALPAMSVLYNLYFPQGKSLSRKIMYALAFPSVTTFTEVILERYTDNIEYVHWTWYFSWLSMLLVLHLSYLYTRWFMRTVRW
ncbi:hypothetical protein L1N85_15115 [Paenibacillus alkaliterrae]|uniref:CBO0543 family protein n=1 Tax=Paenibacillus alkaliterrae TaxID=320909 RepID=UPI001F291050|nr:CBO0543 family protein [Paenibacillus alkaliterrae]MCF2939749.1 hypothetical protein [Paenibacillus alkaliterrae]